MKIFTYFGGIIVSLIYLGIQGVFGHLPIQFDLVFSGILLFTLGLPHGAGDHLIAAKLKKTESGKFQLFEFMTKYLLVMALYGICWYFLPTFSLFIFLVISVFHFGDLENEETHSKNKNMLTYGMHIGRAIVLGSGILGWILSTHWTETRSILTDMSVDPIDQLPPYSEEISMLLIVSCFQFKNKLYFIHTFTTLILGRLLPLYPAFMCYFGACHATYSLNAMSKFLEIPITSLLFKLLPFSVLATFFGMVYVITFNNQIIGTQLFIFLSLLTLPHFFLMHKMASK